MDQLVNENSLLVNAINAEDEKSALFLLGNGADPNITSNKGNIFGDQIFCQFFYQIFCQFFYQIFCQFFYQIFCQFFYHFLGETALELAIKNNLGQAVPSLCLQGANKDLPDADGNVPLWNAIRLELFDIAETLVEQGADVDFWAFNQEKTVEKTLLHRALEAGNETGGMVFF